MSLIVNLKQPKLLKKKKPVINEIQWQAPEYEYQPKSNSWITGSAIVAVVLLLLAFWSKNFLLVIFIIISYFTLISYAYRKPKKANFAITPKGVHIDNSLYEYDNLKSFWISYSPPHINELSLRSNKKIMPYVKIPLTGQNPVAVRTLLIKYIPEKKHKESIIDGVFKGLKY